MSRALKTAATPPVRVRLLLGVVTSMVALGVSGLSRAAAPHYVLAIGHNAPPPGPSGKDLEPLAYADDDAAAVADFFSEIAQSTILLGVPDADTQARFPKISARARPATRYELRLAVASLAKRIDTHRQQDRQPVVILYYSGHGVIAKGQRAELTLQDGSITRTILYEEVLARLPAAYVHLFIDACHAEGVVRPRGEGGEVAAVTAVDEAAWRAAMTLERFPHVGAVIATATAEKAHEWDTLGHGVFTHALLSGLRGAADADGNKRVSYSEIEAFLSAANQEVKDPRGRLRVLVRPPPLRRDVDVIDLATLPGVAWLEGRPASLGHFYIEDERGNRLLDMRAEKRFRVSLAVPAGRILFVRYSGGEARLRLKPHSRRKFGRLRLEKSQTTARGALTSALRQGLFAKAFGPLYYSGFIASSGSRPALPAVVTAEALPLPSSPWPAYLAWSGAGVGLVAALGSGLAARNAESDWERTNMQRKAARAQKRYERAALGFWVSGAVAVLAGTLGFVLYPWGVPESPPLALSVDAPNRGVTLRTSFGF